MHARGALLAADNTWGSGVQYRPLALGADISTMAATKYLSGHSDVMMGTVATTEAAWQEFPQGDLFFEIAKRHAGASIASTEKPCVPCLERIWVGCPRRPAPARWPGLRTRDRVARPANSK